METTSEKIERFKSEYEVHIDIILGAGDTPQNLTHKMILLCTMLDSLSKVAYPEETKVGCRIRKLIDNYSEWEGASRISILHLAKATSVSKDREFERLRQWANEALNSSLPAEDPPGFGGLERDLSIEPTVEQVEKFRPENRDIRLNGCVLDQFTHAAMFGHFRNKLIHEFRMPGKGSHTFIGEVPVYQRLSTADSKLTPRFLSWELIYPVKFVSALCRRVLDNLASTLLQEQEQKKERERPYGAFVEGSYWIDSLNEE